MKNAVKILKRGGVVLFPTETAYGIGCDAANADAVRRIFRIKGRERGKPLPVIAADLAQARRFVRLEGVALRLARRHWPGPLTIILPARDVRIRRAIGATVAIRVSSHRLPRLLTRRLGHPIVATSANRSGRPTCYSVRAVLRQIPRGAIDSVIDAGSLPRRKPSTIVRVVNGRVEILRRGPIHPKSLVPSP